MAATYTLISSNVLASSAASVTFSAIPTTYTDLVLRVSARDNAGGIENNLLVTVNAITSNYSRTFLRGWGGSPATESARNTSLANYNFASAVNGSGTTSNSFSSVEIYIPNYAGSTNKPVSGFQVVESNQSTGVPIVVMAGLLSNTAAITSLEIKSNAGNLVSGSSLYLYGISNA